MTVIQPTLSVELSKYIDDTGERPVIRESDVPVATVAYRAMSGSWGLDELAYQFTLSDAEILAALLYYDQFRTRIDAQEGNFSLEFEALD